MTHVSEMDPGEPISPEDLAKLGQPSEQIKAKVVLLCQMFMTPKRGSDNMTRCKIHGNPAETLYQVKQEMVGNRPKIVLVKTSLIITKDGWRLREHEKYDHPPVTVPVRRVELVISEETGDPMNVKVFDQHGNLFLRLLADNEGNFQFDQLNLEQLP